MLSYGRRPVLDRAIILTRRVIRMAPSLKNNPKIFERSPRGWAFAFLLVALLFAAGVRIRLLDVPLERDEGEYAYAGQLILQGIAPYAKVYNMKLPGIYAAYAAIMAVFGESIRGIHLGLLVVNAGTALLVFLLGKRLFDSFTGTMAGAVYAILSLGPSVQGFQANAEHFVLLPALAGLLLLLRAMESNRRGPFVASGLLLGLAFVTKQHGAAFLVFALLCLFLGIFRRRPVAWRALAARTGLLLAGAAVPFGAVCLLLFVLGLFETFWFWTFDYARLYVSATPLEEGLRIFEQKASGVMAPALFLWLLAALGITALAWDRKAAARGPFLLVFTAFSFLAVCPGFHFRPHYFLFLLPAVSLLAGTAAGALARLADRTGPRPVSRSIAGLLVLLASAHAMYSQREILFQLGPDQVARHIYNTSPFPESVRIADYIRRSSEKTDTIAVIGSEPQIYFYSDRHSATGFIYTYPLLEPHAEALDMQREMIEEIEEAAPRFLLFINVLPSWARQPDSSFMLCEWFEAYAKEDYEIVGLVEILNLEKTRYSWDREARDRLPAGEFWISVHQRME
jgi:hypothetical protein